MKLLSDAEWKRHIIRVSIGTCQESRHSTASLERDRAERTALLRSLADGLVEINGRPVIYVGIQELADLKAATEGGMPPNGPNRSPNVDYGND